MLNWRSSLIPLLLCTTTWLGCSDDEPTPTPTPDAGVEDTQVRVKGFRRNLTASGFTEPRPEDFTQEPVQLFVEQGEALVPFTGAPGAAGEYLFTDVPDGTYYVRWGTNIIVTRNRDLDVSTNSLGRPDGQELEVEPRVDLELDGLEPWYQRSGPIGLNNPSDALQLISEERGHVADVSPGLDMTSGATSVREQGIYYASVTIGSMPRFEAERGDRAWLVQQSSREWGTPPAGQVQRYHGASRGLHLPPFSTSSDTPLVLQGTLQPLPQQQLTLDWKVSEFANLASQVHPQATLRTSSFTVFVAAHGTRNGWVGYSGDLLNVYLARNSASDVTVPMTFGNPSPSTWGLVGGLSHTFTVPATIPGEPERIITGSLYVSDEASRFTGRPLRPGLLPPRELTLDGAEGYTARTFTTGAHVIGWRHPAAGAPDAYRVRVRQMRGDAEFRTTVTAFGFYLDGDATSVRLPADVLQPGQYYFIDVGAIRAEGYDPTGKPFLISDVVTQSTAATVSGLLTVPAQ
ncbi:hypothetical protein [Pyxidicoccus xibeiensis]|uniref:hypothetical protein n=1 Tax=Pyxidicoccus xibeiensis TaxID=2906759 RepID=UPI0020A70935|nr:hypothetical protein [Pyxidicoccus xibeiensis]MCP3138713.1 hypothetical protein [Pyxidicoccus xibeiensis]